MSEKTEGSWVTLLEVNNSAQAGLIKSVLEGSGIKTYIPQESFGLALDGVLGIKIMVKVEDIEKAKGSLEEAVID